MIGLNIQVLVGVTVLKQLGGSLQIHRVQRGFTQKKLAHYAGMSRSKITKIERGKYNGLSVEDFRHLTDCLNLDLCVHLFKRGVIVPSRTGCVEYHPEKNQGAAHCSGQGFTIVWQNGSLCSQSDRNGATVEDVLIGILRRLQELESAGFTSYRQKLALDHLMKAQALLTQPDQKQYA